MKKKLNNLAIYCPELNELCVDGGRFVAVPPVLSRLAKKLNDEIDLDVISWWARETRVIDADCSVAAFSI